MGADRRRTLGRLGEELAAGHMARLGFEVLARNARTRAGEIDLIVFDGETLVFVEVKTRRRAIGAASVGDAPLEGLRWRQRSRLRRASVAWLGERRGRPPRARVLRFDAVGVLLDGHGRLLRLDHLEGAW